MAGKETEVQRRVRELDSQMKQKQYRRKYRGNDEPIDGRRYIVFASAEVIRALRKRGNTREDVIVNGVTMRCRVGSVTDIQPATRKRCT